MDSSNFKVVCDHCDAKLANVFCHSDGAFLCPQCDAQVHSVNKLAQRHLRVPCQSCPVWAYREAKSRGRLLDMPLAACLTRNLQMDIFDGTATCWPSNNASSVALGTPQSDTSSPQATTAAPPANAGSPGSEVHVAALQPASNSWPQNSALALVASQPQPVPQANLGCHSSSQGAEQADVLRAAQFTVSPFSNCSGVMQATTTAMHTQAAERCSAQGTQVSTTTAAAQDLSQAGQSHHSQHTLQRAASQEVMDAVDSMDVALLLDTFGAPLDQLQDKRKAEATAQQQQQQQQQPTPGQMQGQQQPMFALPPQQIAATAQPQQMLLGTLSSSSANAAIAGGNAASVSPGWAPLAQQLQVQQQQAFLQQQQAAQVQQQQQQHQQQQMLQDQMQQRQAQATAVAAATAAVTGGLVPPGGFVVPSSEPMAVPAQRQQPAMRSLSGLSCLSQSALSSSNNDGPQLGSARSSNTMLLQSLEQQLGGAGCTLPVTLTGVPAAGGVAGAAAAWGSIEATQRQLQQLQHQQQQAALQYLQQQQQQQQQVAVALAAAQQQQQQAMQQLLQRSMTDDLPRTSPISIGSGVAATATTLAAAAARREVALRSGLGLSDPGIGLGRGRSLAPSPMTIQQQGNTAFTSATCLLDNLSGVAADPSSIAAAVNVTAAASNPHVFGATATRLLPGGGLSANPAATGAAGGAALPQPLAATRSLDAATSSFSALPMAMVGSGGSTSVSPPNCNTLAGAVVERQLPLNISAQQLAQQMVLPGSAPPALGLAATVGVGMVSRGGSCDLSEAQLMRLSSDGHDAILGGGATNLLGGSMGMLGLGSSLGYDGDTAGLLMRDGSYKDLDPDRAAQLNRYKQKRMLRMRAIAEGAKKVRYECRKQLADTRPRVRGRFVKVSSSDTLLEVGAGPTGGGGTACSMPTSSGNNGGTGSVCTAPPGMSLHQGSGWGLHSHHGHSQPHMQRIDEEGTSEGQSPYVVSSSMLLQRQACNTGSEVGGAPAGVAAAPGAGGEIVGAAAEGGVAAAGVLSAGMTASTALGAFCGFGVFSGDAQKTPNEQQQQHQGAQQQQLRRSQSSSFLDGGRAVGSAPAGLLGLCGNGSTPEAAVEPPALTGPTQDCVITEQDLATLGFDDLPQLSGGFSNAGNNNEDMDESAESMNDGSSRPVSGSREGVRQQQQQPGAQPGGQGLPLAASLQQAQALRPPSLMGSLTASPQVPANASLAMQPQVQLHQQMQLMQQPQQARLSVLDRPIMYGTDRSQFSAAQLSLLDSILTDQYRPSGPGGRH